MFVTPAGEPHRNSNFGRRALRPAVDGTLHRAQAMVRLAPVKPGLTFHGLRHGHKTWMIADGVPEVAQARRLGHILGDRIQETYSHVAAEVETRLLDGLQDRWDKAVADATTTPRLACLTAHRAAARPMPQAAAPTPRIGADMTIHERAAVALVRARAAGIPASRRPTRPPAAAARGDDPRRRRPARGPTGARRW